MTLWLSRAGGQGEREDVALEKNIIVIGWDELPDLSGIKSREELLALLEKTYPNAKPKRLGNWVSQIWPFIHDMQPGDLVALPLKQRPYIAFGRISGPYRYQANMPSHARHTRAVTWLKEIPRTAIDQDLLYSFGAFMTVCRIKRNNAEERVQAMLEGKKVNIRSQAEQSEDGEGLANLDEIALDQIRAFVSQRFTGHHLADLVSAVLSAQGYKLRQSPEGPDGGVDILAGSGPLGLDSPRIAVQVKSGDTPVDIKTVRELQGAMKNFKADYGLFVSWGGYKTTVSREVARLFFEIRLWDSDDLLRETLRQYEKLPDDLQAELPLKRIWILVPSEETT